MKLFDHHSVTFFSILVASYPVEAFERYDKKGHTYSDVPSPASVRTHSWLMAGIRLSNQMAVLSRIVLSFIRNGIKDFFFDLVYLVCIYVWVMCKLDLRKVNNLVKNVLSLSDFEGDVTSTLKLLKEAYNNDRGKSLKLSIDVLLRKQYKRGASIPTRDVR